jgi:hypothetical protein
MERVQLQHKVKTKVKTESAHKSQRHGGYDGQDGQDFNKGLVIQTQKQDTRGCFDLPDF